MLARLHRASVSRAAAALLALALSGAPRAAQAVQLEKPHRCQCKHGAGERCSCPVCGKRAREARRKAAHEAPPCHRAQAEQALAAEEERERHDRDVPCFRGPCGDPGDVPPPTRASAETFTLPDPPLIGRAGTSGAVPAPALRDGVGVPAPEPPPPRAA